MLNLQDVLGRLVVTCFVASVCLRYAAVVLNFDKTLVIFDYVDSRLHLSYASGED